MVITYLGHKFKVINPGFSSYETLFLDNDTEFLDELAKDIQFVLNNDITTIENYREKWVTDATLDGKALINCMPLRVNNNQVFFAYDRMGEVKC